MNNFISKATSLRLLEYFFTKAVYHVFPFMKNSIDNTTIKERCDDLENQNYHKIKR